MGIDFPKFEIRPKEWNAVLYPSIGKLGLFYLNNPEGLTGHNFFYPHNAEEAEKAYTFLTKAAKDGMGCLATWKGLKEILPGKEAVM